MRRFLVAIIAFVFLMMLILSGQAAFSQDTRTVTDGARVLTDGAIPLAELDAYKLKAAEAQANFESLRMDTVIRAFIESNPQVKAFQESATAALADRDALRAKLYLDANLQPEEYELRAADGAFVKIDRSAGK